MTNTVRDDENLHPISIRHLAEAVREWMGVRTDKEAWRCYDKVSAMVAAILDKPEQRPDQIHPGPLDVQPVTIDFIYMDE